MDMTDNSLQQAIINAVPASVQLSWSATQISVQDDDSRTNGAPPYKAGKLLNGICTSGLVYVQGAYILGSIAGHCAQNGASISLSNQFYGYGYNNQYTGKQFVKADIVFIKGPDPYNYTPPLIYANSTKTRRVVGYVPQRDYGEGFEMCMSGAFTGSIAGGATCGPFVVE